MRNENIIWCGDLNIKIGSDILGVEGNHSEVSYGGKKVRQLLETGDYYLVNQWKDAVGGIYTRFDPSNPQNQRLLDYVKQLVDN